MLVRRSNQSSRRGFTLLEVLLVVAILVALAAFAVPSLLGVQEGSNKKQAKTQAYTFSKEVRLYQQDTGMFPSNEQGLMALKQAPNPPPKNWNGPYDTNPAILDPWGAPYNYLYPGNRNGDPRAPDIWSNGPDRQNGTADDIGNWE